MRAWPLACLLVLSCAAHATRVEFDRERLEKARTLAAAQRAPELYARAEAARKEAERAPPDSDAHKDYATEARLWLEAAIAEAERLDLSNQRLAVERDIETEERTLVQLQRALAEVAREVARRAAADIAREEARRALERAALAPKQRPKLSRSEVKAAAQALLARAVLVEAALRGLGQDEAQLAESTQAIAEARALLDKDPDAALARADRALFAGLSVLGPLRAQQSSPSEAEAASLRESVELAGARAVRGDRGLTAVLDGAFMGPKLKAGIQHKLGRLCALAKAHPHGPVRVATPTGGAGPARIAAVQRELARSGCTGERFGVDAAPTPSDHLEVTWVAY